MPPPAEFSGSLKRTSPSTTARWQSIRGVSLLVSHNISELPVLSQESQKYCESY